MISFLDTYNQKILDYSFALFAFLLPLSSALPNILIIPIGLIFLFKIIVLKRIKFSLFWLINLILLIFTLTLAITQHHFIDELSFQKEYLAGLAIFLMIGEVSRTKKIELSFVVGVLSAIIINIFYIAFQVVNFSDLNLSVGSEVNNFLIIERPYFAFFTVLTNFIIFKWIRNGQNKYTYLIATLSALFCFFITARLGMMLHVFLIFHHIFKSLKKTKFKQITAIFLISVSIGLILYNNAYLKKRLRIDSNIEKTYEKLKVFEIRFTVWDCSIQTLSNNWLIGLKSHKNLIPVLTDCYLSKVDPKRKHMLKYYKSRKFNTHNQFFDFWLLSGVIGIFLFIFMLTYPFIKAKQHRQMLTLLVLFIGFFLVENVFHRQLGCYVFAIFLGLYTPKTNYVSWG
ncbi:MAG: O-antigen ligase family protein [Psychroflexus sp.]|nr:O-antigen ligase family protein [Psychroflexus sp.]